MQLWLIKMKTLNLYVDAVSVANVDAGVCVEPTLLTAVWSRF